MRPTRLKATFLFHCAFAHRDEAPYIDVLLPPNDPQHEHGAHMQHLAAMRVPEACIHDDTEFPGTDQQTEILGHRATTDVIWNLRGCDIEIDPPDAESEVHASALIPEVRDDTGTEWVMASFGALAGGASISSRFVSRKVPATLLPGARVRVWGGTMRCGVPDKGLKNRRWTIGTRHHLGLADRMELEKDLQSREQIVVHVRKFNDDHVRKLILRPNRETGIIRLHVSNDPTADEISVLDTDPCSTLPHFKSYAMLLADKTGARLPAVALGQPVLEKAATARRLAILEGDTLCCPCGGGPPEP